MMSRSSSFTFYTCRQKTAAAVGYRTGTTDQKSGVILGGESGNKNLNLNSDHCKDEGEKHWNLYKRKNISLSLLVIALLHSSLLICPKLNAPSRSNGMDTTRENEKTILFCPPSSMYGCILRGLEPVLVQVMYGTVTEGTQRKCCFPLSDPYKVQM